MIEPRRFGLADVILLIVVIASAGACRAGYLYKYADNAKAAGPLRVKDNTSSDMDALVANLKAGKEEPTAHVAPAYPLLLSGTRSFG